ncbi:MAG TPA: hypothetical protein VL202_00320 [Pararhizobium sp.]|uniref:hypothetical protein n=1 Tax=Pararhizobium sp. TaxID=1977563 RepID=UPI002C9D549B|nr:hypothetical protein [Pararhizobium sp.]HTO29614.1 hypothetical protein [Pararhizobium sp.]
MVDPFNAADPFDATAERIRTMLCEAVIAVINTADYSRLSPEKQIEAVICGITTGLLSIAFACIEPAGRDDITAFIKSYIDQARIQVEGIQFAGGSTQ